MAWLLLPIDRWLVLTFEEDVYTEVRVVLEDAAECFRAAQESRRRSAALITESRRQSVALRRAGLLGRMPGVLEP